MLYGRILKKTIKILNNFFNRFAFYLNLLALLFVVKNMLSGCLVHYAHIPKLLPNQTPYFLTNTYSL